MRPIILFALTLASLLLAPAMQGAHAAPTYTPGVKPGDMAVYARASGSWGLGGPPQPPFSQFIDLNYTTLQVTSVTGENVTAAQTFVYANKTSVSDTILGSVATDSGNITFWFIAANLTAGDPIYTTPNTPVINQTFTQTFAGAPRTVDALNITQIPTPGVVLFVNVWWDQATGILLLIDYRVTTPTGSASLFASLVETNIWSPVPQPGFGIDADPNFLIIQEGGSNSSTIGLVSELGFSGNITIRPVAFLCTPTSFCPIVTFTPSTVFLALGGEAFETMNITIPRGTVNGTHTIPVVAFSGSLENATSVTVNVVGPGPSDIPPIADFLVRVPNATRTVQVGQQILFDASPSFDPDGFITNYSWSFGDGAGGFGEFANHAYGSPGNFTATLTVEDNAGLTGTASHQIIVIQAPQHDVGIVNLYASPTIAISGQTIVFTTLLVNLGQQPETVSLTVYYDSHVAATVNGISIPVTQYPYYVNAFWDTSGIAPGNYTISATVSLTTDQNPANNQLTDGQVTILPPPVLVATPTSGPVGTKVSVHGSGFPSPGVPIGYPVTVDVTFDDQFVGFTTMTNGTFTFIFNIPVAQPGPHQIHAYAQFYPSQAEASANFTVTAIPSAGGLTLTISIGTIYFPGDTATIYLLSSLNGSPTQPQTVHLTLLLPNGTARTLTLKKMSTGVFQATYKVPATGSIGTYALVATSQMNNLNATALGSFEVKPTWIQSNSRNIATATAVVGAVGTVSVLGIGWRRGYFTKRKDEFPTP